MKRITKLLLACILFIPVFSLQGCKKEEQEVCTINCARNETEYSFDFKDFVNISVYGIEGKGFVEVTPKDITVNNFTSESDYIAVKKALDALNLSFVIGKNETSFLDVTPYDNLKSGDVVTLSIKDTFKGDFGDLKLNLSPYQFVVPTLDQAQEINLFDDTSVLFYGLEGTDEVRYLKRPSGNLPKELLDHLTYEVTKDAGPLTADKTILSIKANLDENFLYNEENPYYTIDIYLGKHGYFANTQTEKVLMSVISPIDWSTISPEEAASAIFQAIESSDLSKNGTKYNVESIATIQQQIASQSAADRFSYITTFYASNGSERTCVQANVRMIKIGSNYEILNVTNPRFINEDICTGKEPIPGANIVYNFGVGTGEIQGTEPTESPDMNGEIQEIIQEEVTEESNPQ